MHFLGGWGLRCVSRMLCFCLEAFEKAAGGTVEPGADVGVGCRLGLVAPVTPALPVPQRHRAHSHAPPQPALAWRSAETTARVAWSLGTSRGTPDTVIPREILGGPGRCKRLSLNLVLDTENNARV